MAAAAELLAGATKGNVRRGALDGLQVELGGAQRLQVHRPARCQLCRRALCIDKLLPGTVVTW